MFRLQSDQQAAKKPKVSTAVQYLNDEITFPVVRSFVESHKRVQKPLLQSFISRSGRIVDQANDYFVAVIRLAISLTVPIFMPEMALPSIDGVSTLMTVSLMRASETLGVQFSLPATIKLQVPISQRQYPRTTADASLYAVFNHPNELCAAVNEAVALAKTLLPTTSDEMPYLPEMQYDPVSKLYSFTVYRHDEWVQPVYTTQPTDVIPPGLELPKFALWFNHCSYPLLKGFDTFHVTKDDYTPSLQNLDYLVKFRPNEAARVPVPLQPTPDPAVFGYKLMQDTPTVLPTLETIRVITDLPSVGEIIPSTDDVETAGILTDFKLDNSLVGSSAVLYYNASLGDARYIKLTGTSPIQAITYRVEAIDTYGQVHRIRLQGPGDFFSIKMAFVENSIVENF